MSDLGRAPREPDAPPARGVVHNCLVGKALRTQPSWRPAAAACAGRPRPRVRPGLGRHARGAIFARWMGCSRERGSIFDGPSLGQRGPNLTLRGSWFTPRGSNLRLRGPRGTPRGSKLTPRGPRLAPRGGSSLRHGPGPGPHGPRRSPHGPGQRPRGPRPRPRPRKFIPPRAARAPTSKANENAPARARGVWRSTSGRIPRAAGGQQPPS